MPIEIKDKKTAARMNVIRNELGKLNAERVDIENEIQETENKKLIGKCFKTRNCYSCPSSDDDYWWLYLRVDATKSAFLQGLLFEVDQFGKTTIDPEYSYMSVDRYQEITREEFDAAFTEVITSLEQIK